MIMILIILINPFISTIGKYRLSAAPFNIFRLVYGLNFYDTFSVSVLQF